MLICGSSPKCSRTALLLGTVLTNSLLHSLEVDQLPRILRLLQDMRYGSSAQ